MNRLETIAALALGGVLVAGCGSKQDPMDSESATPTTEPVTEPTDTMPAPDTTAPVPNSGEMTPTPSTTDPYAQPTPTTPDEVPPPSN